MDHWTAAPVSGLASGVSGLGTGGYHSCALTTTGGVKCWGYNYYGQLGDASNTYRPLPVTVSGLASGVKQITAGLYHTCALTTGGGVKCWGFNVDGELGNNGAPTNSNVPVDVSGLTSGVAYISAGRYHTCAVTTGGGVKCWGYNFNGQLGNNNTNDLHIPVDVSGLGNGISKVSGGGGHTCALTTGGRIKYWGNNTNGELGDGTPMEKHVPTDVLGFTGSGAIAITASQYRTCAVTTGGVVKCWGWNNRGQVGNGTVNTLGGVTTPVDVWGLSGVTQVSSGNDHTCAVTGARQVACWGLNYYGQLGNGQSSYQLTPGDVSGLASGISAISSGATHTCVLTTGGAVKCWGDNNNGQLGDGTGLQRYTIIAVAGLSSGVAQISGSGDHTCALTSLGGVKCWGLSGLADVSGLTSGVKAISVSQDHSCAVTTAGTIKCWGDNSWGQLGDGTKNPSQAAPLAVSGNSSGASAVSVAFGHTCALVSGCVKCWGLNQYGELGDGTNNDSSTPVNVSGLASGVSAVITGAQSPGGRAFSCALVTGGAIKCWGTSLVTLSSPTPLSMNGFTTGVSKISAGDNHFCAVTTDGRVKCMGSNQFGPLGDGQGYDGTAYTYGLAAGSILDVSAGREHTCALTSAGGVKCWGDNSYGQLGYGEARYIAVPRLVLGFGQSTYLYLPLVKR